MTHEIGQEKFATIQQSNEAMRRRLALQFGHAMIRHELGEIPTEEYDKLHDHYVDQAQNHTSVIDRKAVRRELDANAEEQRLEAMADVWEAKAELGEHGLPEYEFVPMKDPQQEMSNLMHENLRLNGELDDMRREKRAIELEVASLKHASSLDQAELVHLRQQLALVEADNDRLKINLSMQDQVKMYGSLGLDYKE